MKQRRPLTTIGSKEMIDVPAKIDTGADYSSIWASDVRMQDDGSLRFKLFSPHSRFFSGRTVTTTHFRSTAIKNSFGTGEQRYMVQLLIRVRGRTIRAWFTLADRS